MMSAKVILFVCFSVLVLQTDAQGNSEAAGVPGRWKPGSCPQTLAKQSQQTSGSSACGPGECRRDSDCPRDLKCCSNICGSGRCTRPIGPTPTTSPTRPKPGSCPQTLANQSRPPSGSSACGTTECRRDQDCARNLKCCSNICGVGKCTEPGRDNTPTRPTCPNSQSLNPPGPCRNECFSNDNCDFGLSCCLTRCGARRCVGRSTIG